MRTRTPIEGLESRRLFSADNLLFSSLRSPSAGFATIGDNVVHQSGPTSIDLSDDAVARDGLIVIRFPDDSGGMITGAAANGSRVGNFALPTVKPDGSVRLAGSSGDDAITAESTVGYHESLDEHGRPADHEFDFIHAIDPKTGERYLVDAINLRGIDGMLRTRRGSRDVEASDLAVLKGEPTSEEMNEKIAESEARLAAQNKQIARLEALKTLTETGHFVHYTLAGVYDFYVQVADGQTSAARVTVDAGAGDDSVSISPNVPMKATIYGGSGADVLTTGKKTSLVFAGGGKDRLINRSTKGATLDGGQGADRYFNRTTANVDVVGRADGDQMIFADGAITVAEAVSIGGVPDAEGYITLRIKGKVNDDGTIDWVAVDAVKPTA